MLQKQIYSMPEAFMGDESVPVKWRLYGIINGFWINGLKVYAANKFFADKLNCSERMIAYALEDLEKIKLVRREINGHNRKIHPYGFVNEGETPFHGGGNPISPAHETPFHPNASSIAPSINTASAVPLKVVPDSELEGRVGKADKKITQAYEAMIRWAEVERGFPFLKTERLKQYKALKIAKENNLKSSQLKERWEEMSSDKFWSATGFDWMNVVLSFNKKQ